LDKNREIGEPSVQEYVVKNRLQTSDEVIHGWYRFVLGYPPHLVREYLDLFNGDPESDLVFDPFCGTATTPIEARLQGFPTVSADVNPISILATRVKLTWDMDIDSIQTCLADVLSLATDSLSSYNLEPLPAGNHQLSFFDVQLIKKSRTFNKLASKFNPDKLLTSNAKELIPNGFISPKPLLRILTIRYAIDCIALNNELHEFLYLALANTIVKPAGNLAFGPEVYRLPPKEDVDVLGSFAAMVNRMVSDLRTVTSNNKFPFPPWHVFNEDARILSSLSKLPAIGIVITSPPYPNEKDYTRSTRLESVILGLIETKKDLRKLKNNLLRSNTRNVFVNDSDDNFVKDISSITHIADMIEQRRLELGKTSGFERLYHRVTRLYFGGMYRHLSALLPRLRPGGRCAYVVGDQMSYFRIHIRTAELLADVAIKAGYKVEGVQLWRTRRSTTTGLDLNENVLILKRPI
jgi:hypothetical protein